MKTRRMRRSSSSSDGDRSWLCSLPSSPHCATHTHTQKEVQELKRQRTVLLCSFSLPPSLPIERWIPYQIPFPVSSFVLSRYTTFYAPRPRPRFESPSLPLLSLSHSLWCPLSCVASLSSVRFLFALHSTLSFKRSLLCASGNKVILLPRLARSTMCLLAE